MSRLKLDFKKRKIDFTKKRSIRQHSMELSSRSLRNKL